MLWGVILFGYILGGLASLLTNADAQRSRYIHRLNTIKEHLKEAGVSDQLKKKVLGYYEYLVCSNVECTINTTKLASIDLCFAIHTITSIKIN